MQQLHQPRSLVDVPTSLSLRVPNTTDRRLVPWANLHGSCTCCIARHPDGSDQMQRSRPPNCSAFLPTPATNSSLHYRLYFALHRSRLRESRQCSKLFGACWSSATVLCQNTFSTSNVFSAQAKHNRRCSIFCKRGARWAIASINACNASLDTVASNVKHARALQQPHPHELLGAMPNVGFRRNSEGEYLNLKEENVLRRLGKCSVQLHNWSLLRHTVLRVTTRSHGVEPSARDKPENYGIDGIEQLSSVAVVADSSVGVSDHPQRVAIPVLRDAERSSVEEDSLHMVDWPQLCESVAGFASTSLGNMQLFNLCLPGTQEESEELLKETEAMIKLESANGGSLEFGGIRTDIVSNAMGRARRQTPLTGVELLAVASMLEAAQQMRRTISTVAAEKRDDKQTDTSLLPLLAITKPIATHPEIIDAVKSTVHDDDGSIRENASPELRRAVIQRDSLRQKLRDLLNRTVSKYDNSSGVVEQGGRLCIAVGIAGRSVDPLPGLLIGSTAGGSTLYLEPPAAVPLNNKLSEANAAVAKAEEAVRWRLTQRIIDCLDDVEFVLNSVVELDVIAGRARYSSWMGGCRPQFVDAAEVRNNAASLSPSKREGEREGNDAHGEAVPPAAAGEGDAVVAKGRGTANPTANGGTAWVLHLEKARHPLLVQQHRDGIRKARGRARMKDRAAMMAKMRGGGLYVVKEAEQTAAEAEAEAEALAATPPVPIDICVQRGVRVVIITGPNTGGKTASMKTVALAALMAKAGLYVLAQDPVCIPWFDKVLADIGDDQSLSQSLSTFSGHIRRVMSIKRETTGCSLVLLDEVGAGTDPVEGAALGISLLQSFAQNGPGGSLLTMSTTHHGELKALKYVDRRFENASVEFDEDKLAPTYRLLWGIPGRSNALNIAWKLGVLMSIIDEARRLHGSTNAEVNEVIMNLENERRRYEGAISQAEELLEEAERMHSDVKEAVLRLQRHQAELLLRRSDEIQSIFQAAQSSIQLSLRKARNKRRKQLAAPVAKESSEGQQRDEQPIGMDRTRAPPQQDANNKADSKSLADQETLGQEQGTMDRAEGAAATTTLCIPKVGETVVVQRLKMEGRVLTVSEAKKEVTVQCGFMQVTVSFSELSPTAGSPIPTKKQMQEARNKTGVELRVVERKAASTRRTPVPIKRSENTVDIRGMCVDEAMEFLDDAIERLGMEGENHALFVIHGIGTGALKAATQIHVSMHPLVSKVEDAEAKHGGSGTSVIYLR